MNHDNTRNIIAFCISNDVNVAGTIPFNPIITQAMVAGTSVVEYSPTSNIVHEIAKLWKQVLKPLNVDVLR